ncbi:MAG: type II secretion system protein, partial [Gammaproteobacteria bacterium]
FTLIEVAIAIVVIALLLGSLLGPLSVRIEQADRQKTQELLDEIKEALYGFAAVNGRLPCPDSDGNDGREDRTTACTVVVGNLPWADLAVPELDAWGRRFFYRVTPSFGDDVTQNTVALPASCITLPAQASFALCSDGDIDILDGAGGNNVATDIPAVIVSYGANGGLTPTSADERENWPTGPNPTIFVSKGYSQNPASEFDDLVAWISPHILKNRMIAAGRLP